MRPFVGPVIAPPQWQYRRYQQWHRDKIATPAGPANTQRPTHSLNWCAYALMWMGGCHAHRHTHTRTLVSVNALQLIRETLIRGTRLIRQADNVVRARQESERFADVEPMLRLQPDRFGKTIDRSGDVSSPKRFVMSGDQRLGHEMEGSNCMCGTSVQ